MLLALLGFLLVTAEVVCQRGAEEDFRPLDDQVRVPIQQPIADARRFGEIAVFEQEINQTHARLLAGVGDEVKLHHPRERFLIPLLGLIEQRRSDRAVAVAVGVQAGLRPLGELLLDRPLDAGVLPDVVLGVGSGRNDILPVLLDDFLIPVGCLIPIFQAFHTAGVFEFLNRLETVADAHALERFLAIERIGVEAPALRLLRLLDSADLREQQAATKSGSGGDRQNGPGKAKAGVKRHRKSLPSG